MKKKTKRVSPTDTLQDAYLAHTDRVETLCDNFAAAVPRELLTEWEAFVDGLRRQQRAFEERIEKQDELEYAMEVVRREAGWWQIGEIAEGLDKDDTRSLVSDIAGSQGFILLAPQDARQHERCEAFACELFPAYNDQLAFVMGL